MGTQERRQRDKEEMRTRICRAAMKLFLSEGFERTSIRRIADAIEYTPGAIYSYFEDKDAILFALHDEGFDKLYAMQTAGPPLDDPYDRLVRCGEVYLRFALENPEYYDLMFIMASTGKQIADERHDWMRGLRSYEHLRTIVNDCLATGQLPPGDPEAVTFAFWSAVHGMAALVIRQRCVMLPPESVGWISRSAIQYVLDGLRRPKK